MHYLLDTNAVIDYLKGVYPATAVKTMNAIVDDEPIISIITQMETLGFNFKSIAEQNTVETFVNGSTIINIDAEIVNKTIDIRKSKKIALPDAIIAATAIINGLTLITRNLSDFSSIQGIQVKDPYTF